MLSDKIFYVATLLALWMIVQYMQKDSVEFLVFLALSLIVGFAGVLRWESEQRDMHERREAMRRHPAGSAL